MQLEHLLQFINKYMPIFEVVNFYNSTQGEKKGGGKKSYYTVTFVRLFVLGVFVGLLFGVFSKKKYKT